MQQEQSEISSIWLAVSTSGWLCLRLRCKWFVQLLLWGMNTVVPCKEEDMIYMFFEEMVDAFSFQNYRMSKPSRTFNTGKKHAKSNCKSFWDKIWMWKDLEVNAYVNVFVRMNFWLTKCLLRKIICTYYDACELGGLSYVLWKAG